VRDRSGKVPWLAGLALALVVTALAARGARRPAHGGSARLPTDSPVHSLDPLEARWPAEALLATAIFDSPYLLEPNGRPRPHILLPVQGEGRALRFTVHPNVMFHDGARLEATHVHDSLLRLARSRDAGWLLAMVEGTAPGRSAPSGLKLVGTKTIEIRLASAQALDLLVLALATPQAGVVASPRKALAGIGTGPFALRGRTGGDISLRANQDYFDGPAYLSDLALLAPTGRDDHIRRLQLGKADGSLLGDSVYGEPPIKGIALHEGPFADVAYLVFNTARGPARQEPIRRAVHVALDRQRLAAGGAQPVGFPGSSAAPRSDAARARALLGKLGPTPTEGRPLVLMVEDADALGVSLGPLIQRDLATLGLDVELVKAASSEVRSRLSAGTWDLRLQTLSPVSPDTVLQLGQVLALGGMSEEAFDLVRRAPASRPGEIARAVAALEARLPVIPLVQHRNCLHHVAALRGVRFDGRGLLRLADLWVRPAVPAREGSVPGSPTGAGGGR
jgi:MarR-like DNA-binding transcriptional regulator SgrR of sgrS sRNA